MTVMNANELARKLSTVLDRLEQGAEAVLVVRRRHAVAKLTAESPQMTAAEALSDLGGGLTHAEGEAWLRDMRRMDRKSSHGMRDPWA